MKKGLVICGPDVAHGPLALLSGSFEEKCAKAAALGYDGIELMVRDPAGLDWPRVKQTLADCQLGVPQIVTGELWGADKLVLVTPDEDLHRRALARTQAVIDLAAYLGAIVNIGRLRGRLDWLDDPAGAWGRAVEMLRPAAQYAADCGVRIALEPINRYETDFIQTVDDGLRMACDIGLPNLGLMLDLFHMNIEEASIERSLEAATEHVWHVHIADSNRLYPGAGHLDFAPIFDTLRGMGYDGYISAELLPRPDADTAAQKTIEFMNKWI
jgi:sugar phosphate isomerase/epimerase